MAPTCSGCLKKIPDKCFLTCTSCKNQYDLECANVSTQRFYNTMTREHKQSWICQLCRCKMPKKDNSNTPVRQREDENTNQTSIENIENKNITMRKTQSNTQKFTFNDSSISVDINLLGDTIQNESYNNLNSETGQEASIQTNLIGIEHFEKLLDKKLKENKQSLISELQTLILSEVNNALCDLKSEMLKRTNALQSELQDTQKNKTPVISHMQNTIQTEINRAITHLKEQLKQETDNLKQLNIENKTEIEKLKHEIEIMKNENKTLKNENTELGNKEKTRENIRNETVENTKKFVIYGMEEIFKEPDYALHLRIIDVFRNILNIDLMGYIEDTRRIGKYQNKGRPLIVELISKRMAKYLLENSHHLSGTGIAISPLLDEKQRRERRTLREEMIKARKNGLHATIRDNQLYIQGKSIHLNNYNSHNNTTHMNSEHRTTLSNQNRNDNRKSNANTEMEDFFRYYRQHTTF